MQSIISSGMGQGDNPMPLKQYTDFALRKPDDTFKNKLLEIVKVCSRETLLESKTHGYPNMRS